LLKENGCNIFQYYFWISLTTYYKTQIKNTIKIARISDLCNFSFSAASFFFRIFNFLWLEKDEWVLDFFFVYFKWKNNLILHKKKFVSKCIGCNLYFCWFIFQFHHQWKICHGEKNVKNSNSCKKESLQTTVYSFWKNPLPWVTFFQFSGSSEMESSI
jgi:hypothetical protein